MLRYGGWTRSTNLARLWLYATVPLRALKLMAGAGYPNILVLEYALGGDAHIETLARLAGLDMAVVTTIGLAQLQYLTTGAGEAEHKGAMIRARTAEGLVLIFDNSHNVGRPRWAEGCEGRERDGRNDRERRP